MTVSFLCKYGPDRLSQVLGEANRRAIARTIRGSPLMRALIAAFGLGKTTFTHLILMGLYCLAEGETRPCGECANCRYIRQRVSEHPFLRDRPPVGDPFEIIDCTRLRAGDMKRLVDELLIFATRPRIVVFDEFHVVPKEIQSEFLKLTEARIPVTLLFSFAEVNTGSISQALLQRLAPPLMPRRPATEEFHPLIRRILEAEDVALVDEGAIDTLVEVCGRVPRLVLNSMQEIKIRGEGLSSAVVEDLAEGLQIIGDGKNQ